MLHGHGNSAIEQRAGVNTLTVQDAMMVVAVGTGKYAEVMEQNGMSKQYWGLWQNRLPADNAGAYFAAASCHNDRRKT